jgi:hypothetical protein
MLPTRPSPASAGKQRKMVEIYHSACGKKSKMPPPAAQKYAGKVRTAAG